MLFCVMLLFFGAKKKEEERDNVADRGKSKTSEKTNHDSERAIRVRVQFESNVARNVLAVFSGLYI